MARHNIFRLCLSLQMQSWLKVWFALVWLQLRLRCVFSVLAFALMGTLTWKSKCRKLSVLVLSTCATLITLAAFSPDRQRNALSMPLSHHGLTTVTHSYTVRLQLTSPVYSVYKSRLPGRLRVARVATVPHPCYANSTGCPLCAELISSYLYSLTKPCTTTRQCICVNSCAHINRQEHCALRTITCYKWSVPVPKLVTARSLSLLRPYGTIYQRSLRLVTISPVSNVYWRHIFVVLLISVIGHEHYMLYIFY